MKLFVVDRSQAVAFGRRGGRIVVVVGVLENGLVGIGVVKEDIA